MNAVRGFAVVAGLLFGVSAWAADDAAPATPAADADADSPADSHCLRATGSRIEPEPGKCLPVAGRVITNSEMRRTGATNAAEAVRNLIP